MQYRIASLLLVVAALLITSCSNYRHCQWRTGDQAVNDTAEYSLRFIESDDEGWFWDPRQVESALDLIRDKAAERDTIVVTFVHGWHHSADCCDGNVEGFRNTLSKLRASLRRDFNVVGLYIGWRGQSLPMPLDYLTFWGRKGAAERVGQNDLKEFMARLQQLFLEYRPDAREPEPSNDAAPAAPDHFLGMVTIGHSFGGQVLLKAVTGTLEDQLQTFNLSPAYLRDAQPATPDPDNRYTVTGIGDLIVLVNPAAEASQYQRLHLLSRGLNYTDLQTPVILTVSAENDSARHRLFTLGRRLGEFFTGKPHKDNEAQRTIERQALGVYPGHVTHQLVPTDNELKLISSDVTGDPRACPTSGQLEPKACKSQWYEWNGEPVHTKPNSLAPGDGKVDRFDFSGFGSEVVFNNVELSPIDGEKEEYATALPYQPFIVARASRTIIDDHSGIFTQPFLQFLVPYIAYIEVKSERNRQFKQQRREEEMQVIKEERVKARTRS